MSSSIFSAMKMAFFNSWFTESIKKCCIKYVIERYLGRFFSRDLDFSSLDIELLNGKCAIKNIPLNAPTINEEVSTYLPLKLENGFVEKVEVSIPWSSLLNDSCTINLTGISLTFRKNLKYHKYDPNQVSISAKSIMSSSMEIAEEIMNKETDKMTSDIQGVEIFADVINSCIRRFKLSAHNTSITFQLPGKRLGTDHELQLTIGHIQVEEEEITLDNQEVKEDKNNAFSDTMTKLITVEGIEIRIDGSVVSKLYGKHRVKIQFDGNRIDTNLQLGSYIFAILNSEHLKVLHEFIKIFDDSGSLHGLDSALREKPMTSKDYKYIYEIMKSDGQVKNAMTSSMLSYSSKNWGNCISTHEGDMFMPFTGPEENQNKNDSEVESSVLSCNLKVPGIMLCLVSSERMPHFPDLQLIDSLQTFIGINNNLNEIFRGHDHIRVSACNLFVDITKEALQFSCTNVSVYEYFENNNIEYLDNILLVKDKETSTMQSTVKLKLIKNNIEIALDSTTVKLDLTLIERHYKLFELFTNSETSKVSKIRSTSGGGDDELNVVIDCEKLDLEMYFPIPDLRPERDEYSTLHDEILLVELKDLQLRLDSNDGNLVCSRIDIDLKTDDTRKKVFHSESDNRDISLDFSTACSVPYSDSFDQSCLLNSVSNMQESVNYITASTINHNKSNSPFTVKRKMIDDEGNEQIVTPGDRDHLERFLAYNKESTKLFIRIHVPYGNVYLEDKSLFELIYNRFVNDLILWTPYFSKRSQPLSKVESLLVESSNIFTSALSDPTSTLFLERSDLAEHGFHAPSSLTLDDNAFLQQPPLSSQQMASSFYNCRNDRLTDSMDSMTSDSYHSLLEHSNNPTSIAKPSNEFMLELEVDHLNLDFYTESRCKSTIFTQNLLLGVVVGPESERSSVVCLCAEQLTYKYGDEFVLTRNQYMSSDNCEVNMAMQIKRETDMLKKIKLTLQLKQGLLFGLELPIFEELYNFVNLKDDEILGYVCPKVVLELHTDIVKSGIFFDNLKERPALLRVEDIYLTSMVIENTSETILRFFIEEALLCFKRNGPGTCLDTMRSYIAVVDSGIIDLNLKISKDGRLELKVSNNEINVRVCPDSLVTLLQFLQSFASQVSNDSSESDIESNINEIYMHKTKQNDSDLIADAMFDLPDQSNEDKENFEEGSLNRICDCDPVITESYHILDDDPGTGIHLSKEPEVKILAKKSIKITENHFAIPNFNVIPEITASTLTRYLLDKMSVQVSLYGGRDFEDISSEVDDLTEEKRNSRLDVISQANISIRSGKSSKSEPKVRFQPQTSVVWENIDISSNNGYLTSNLGTDNHCFLKSAGGSRRRQDVCVVLILNKIKLLFDLFDKDSEMAWRFLLFVEEIEILDRVNASKIKKMLYEYYSESTPRRKYSNMFSIKLNCKRNFEDMNEECDLIVSLKPLRVNIDQDALIALMDFFTVVNEILSTKVFNNKQSSNQAFNSDSEDNEGNLKRARCDSKFNSNEEICVNTTKNGSNNNIDDVASHQAHSMESAAAAGRGRRGSTSSNSSLDNIFIKSFTFSPAVLIRLDYHGKSIIDLKTDLGALPGIFLGLAQLNQSELHLKRLSNKHGLLGLEKVIVYAVDEWTKDIRKTQVPKLIGSVGPMTSLVQLCNGVRDLFWLPIEQYRRDQRIVRGIQRGAYAFSISTAMATLDLANRLLNLIQCTAQFAHDVVTPPTIGGSYRPQIVFYSQPRDAREGATAAYGVMREGFTDMARGFNSVLSNSDDFATVVGQVVRKIPSTVVSPLILLSRGSSNFLVGVRNQLTPEARKDDHEKWKNANQRL